MDITIRRALVSVSDKTGLIPLARLLRRYHVEILSTGGTLASLKRAGVPARPIEVYTGFPEMMDGRVKTLHPKIHGGLLYRRDKKAHRREAERHGILPIDLVIVNLYPFEEVIQKRKVSLETAVENIDIGGPAMLRSAAKNHEAVTVLCDPADYPALAEELKKYSGRVSKTFRQRMAAKVFERTALYDRTIANFLAGRFETKPSCELPKRLDGVYERAEVLRYGENPHQRAALYRRIDKEPRFVFRQWHGKELSYNNLLDMEAAVDVIREFEEPAACVIKHTNPCGIAEASRLADALRRAIECDPMSAFGGIVGINRPCTKETAAAALELLRFFEVFVAPAFETPALNLLKTRKNLRVIAVKDLNAVGPYDLRFIKSGILLEERDQPIRFHEAKLRKNLKVVTQAKLDSKAMDDLLFAWKCVKTVKSNAIVITQGRQTVGIGAGQMSRVDAVEIACRKAGYDRTDGGMLASDAFFPMPDSIEVAHRYKIRAVIQPGGSLRDAEVIAACDRFGIAMVFTGERHFRH